MYSPEDDGLEYEETEFDKALRELIEGEIKSRMEQTVSDLAECREDNDRMTKSIRITENKMRQMEIDHKNALAEKEKQAKRDMFGGFTVGDPCWYKGYVGKEIPCPECDGTSKLEAVTATGKAILSECPACRYDHGKREVGGYKPTLGKVSRIECTLVPAKEYVTLYVADRRDDSKQAQLFHSEQECQVACDAENRELEERRAKKTS